MSILSNKVDQESLETEFLIAFCCQSGDKWQSKTLFLTKALFLAIFDLRLSIVQSVFHCCLSGVKIGKCSTSALTLALLSDIAHQN